MTEPVNIREVPITSISNFLQFIEEECAKSFVLFRGQREDTVEPKDLVPKIARPCSGINTSNVIQKEKKLFEDFTKKAVPYIEKRAPENNWEWLTLAQHHGLPTRLLDWSRNPLAALLFGVNSPPKTYKSYGIVWVFKPEDNDFVDINKNKEPFSIEKTMVYEPSHIARRITAQSACFTVHKYMDKTSKFIPLNKNKAYTNKLTKIVVPGRHFDKFRNQLDRCGINEATLFADLDSLCGHLSWKEL